MATGRINLGANKSPLRKLLSRSLLRGFFYWRRHKGLWHKRLLNLRVNENAELPARQHLIFQNLCRQWRGKRKADNSVWLSSLWATLNYYRWPIMNRLSKVSSRFESCLPAPFYKDNSLQVTISKPLLGRMVNFLRKRICCTGWIRTHSTTKSRMGKYGGIMQVRLNIWSNGDHWRLRPRLMYFYYQPDQLTLYSFIKSLGFYIDRGNKVVLCKERIDKDGTNRI